MRRAGKLECVVDQPIAQLGAETRRRRDLDHLLAAALQGAIALPQVRHRAAVADHLHLDVARRPDQPLDEEIAIAEAGLGLRAAAREGFLQCAFAEHRAHAAATAAGHGLDHDGTIGAKPPQKCTRLRDGRRGRGTGQRRHSELGCELPRRVLVAKAGEGVGAGTDEGQAGLGTAPCEVRVLRQKAIAGMDRAGAGLPRNGNDGIAVEIGRCAATRQLARRVGLARMQACCVIGRIDGYALQAQFRRRAENADSDLSAIGDEQPAGDHGDGDSSTTGVTATGHGSSVPSSAPP